MSNKQQCKKINLHPYNKYYFTSPPIDFKTKRYSINNILRSRFEKNEPLSGNKNTERPRLIPNNNLSGICQLQIQNSNQFISRFNQYTIFVSRTVPCPKRQPTMHDRHNRKNSAESL